MVGTISCWLPSRQGAPRAFPLRTPGNRTAPQVSKLEMIVSHMPGHIQFDHLPAEGANSPSGPHISYTHDVVVLQVQAAVGPSRKPPTLATDDVGVTSHSHKRLPCQAV